MEYKSEMIDFEEENMESKKRMYGGIKVKNENKAVGYIRVGKQEQIDGSDKVNIVEINKKLLDYQIDLVSSRGCCDTVDFQEELQFVLNKLEQAEKALSDTKDELAKVVNKMCGGTVKQYIFEETREVYYSVEEALQAIRKGD